MTDHRLFVDGSNSQIVEEELVIVLESILLQFATGDALYARVSSFY